MGRLRITPVVIAETFFGAAFNVVAVLLSPLLRPWYSRWGATEAETKRSIPGDGLVPHPKIESTRAITIKAPPDKIWPWLVQIGWKRAGWYSYDVLEQIVGAGGFIDGNSANRIIPELQNLKKDDLIYMHRIIPGLRVHTLEPYRLIIFQTRLDSRTGKYFELDQSPKAFVNSNWVFYLEEIDEKETRFIIRSRFDYDRSFLNTVMWKGFTDPISFVMERKMFLGIKKRAEDLARG